SRPALALDSTSFASNGTTAQAANAGASVISGASTYSDLCALLGRMTSLNRSLNTSAKACSTPQPTYMGPSRTSIQPISLRSQTPQEATAPNPRTAIAGIFSTIHSATPTGPSEASQSCSGAVQADSSVAVLVALMPPPP